MLSPTINIITYHYLFFSTNIKILGTFNNQTSTNIINYNRINKGGKDMYSYGTGLGGFGCYNPCFTHALAKDLVQEQLSY